MSDVHTPQEEPELVEGMGQEEAKTEQTEEQPLVDHDQEADTDSPNEKHAGSKGEGLPSLEEAMEVIAKLQLENRDLKESLAGFDGQNKRLQADFINFRKRKEKEVSDMVRFANEDLLKTLLPILDNFDRTLDAIEKTDNLSAVKEGIGLVSNSLRKQLVKVGLEPINTEIKTFDPALHEAITTVPVEDEAQKGQILEFVEQGYKLKDRVIRYAKVVVGE